MEPWSRELAGRLEEHTLESAALRGNPLGDPAARPLWVYTPPAYAAEPDRARACVQMYRVFQLHESPAILRGRYAHDRLTVPTRLLFGTDDTALRPQLLAGYQHQADDIRVELVPGCGHFIADEKPDLVAERALQFFA